MCYCMDNKKAPDMGAFLCLLKYFYLPKYLFSTNILC